ncbi:MAG TPA: fused MFS/spermidine synthase [Acidimicrobiales bacterium]|nr:fused MFS/spermidine synthase [Acidimicrobiales bacterium]
MTRPYRFVLLVLFAGTGFSALTLQVVWQRVISLHAGVDLFSIATVVSAFLAGLGLGSLLGGVLADRLGPRRSLLAFAASNAGIGIFAWFSIWLFYDLYRSSVPILDGLFSAFAFNFALLIVPTTLMGLSLPLVARGLVEQVEEAAPMVGRLYAVNTIGAGVGAGIGGWLLLGNLGFLGTVRLAGSLNLGASALILTLWKTASARPPDPVDSESDPEAQRASGRPWKWLGLYGLTGAVALGLELVFFRVIDALMRTNSYTFGHLLSLYLLLFGAGAAMASRLVRRTTRPARWFLGLQYGVGLTALTGLLLLVEVPARLGLSGPFDRHFAVDGYNTGGYRLDSADELIRLGMVNLLGPLLIMGAPVVLMGMSFPFMQALVSERVDTLGRRTGLLLFTNVVGNVTGTLIVGFVLVDRLGTSGSLRLLAGLLVLPGLAAAALATTRLRRAQLSLVAVGILGALLAVFPSNNELWAYLHGAEGESRFALAEDRACVTALKQVGSDDLLYVNAASQNGYPFDDFHILIGLVPTLIHPAPDHVLAVGLGIGATPYGMSRDRRVEHLDVVEICGGALTLQGTLAERGAAESERLLNDDRVDLQVGDGRKFLLGADEPFDVVTVDAVRPQSAFSGSLYSVEFYDLVRSRLGAQGILSGWVPTGRVLNSVTQAFPYVVRLTVANYHGAQFFLASEHPIVFDRGTVLARFQDLEPHRWFSEAQTQSIQQFLEGIEPVVVRDGQPPAVVGGNNLNHDLMPRDEYFLNNPALAPAPG